MTFNSICFLFAFLPIVLAGYYLLPLRFKKLFLVLAGFVFYAWGSPRNLIILLVSIVFHYIAGLEFSRLDAYSDARARKIVLISTVAADLFLLGFFKYATDSLPLGISFYTFTVLSYLFDVYRGRAQAQRNLLSFMLYVSFFPKIISGPIVQYADMEEQLEGVHVRGDQILHGAQMFLTGLLKKVLIADQLAKLFSMTAGGNEATTLAAWLGMIAYSLQLYFDFSGYSDMAIGLAQMFGFSFERNFDHPYLSASISEFWRRWHISLGNWFKQYVYFPLGGNRVPKERLLVNLLIVWALTGVWHGNTWNFVVWGLYHGAFVILERFVIKDRLDGVPRALRVLVTDLVVFVGWVFFFSPSLGSAVHYIGRLAGIGTVAFTNAAAGFALGEYWLLIVIAFIGCGTLMQRVYRGFFYDNAFALGERAMRTTTIVVTLLLFALAVAGIISNTYSTFLYVQF